MFIGGVVSTHGIIDNWQSKNAMAKRVYGAYLTDTKFITVFSGIAASGFDSLFKGLMMTIYGETNLHTDNAVLSNLYQIRTKH